MRLLNAHNLKLEEVWDETVEKYTILSHRWEDGEVSFQDMQDLSVASNMRGFAKIQQACKHALSDKYNYVWVDTCCINKESSAELTEALNSMYRWYKASAVCYAFLSDVHVNAPDGETMERQIQSSMWFKRGWTLQELLAPQHVVFFDQQWQCLGTKQTLNTLLTLRTGIDEAILKGEPLSNRSIAQRMSWASERVTTRIEDTAYCLLGIFDVSMPMLYGEGEKAFLRLQEQIIKQSDDHTIFAWPIHRNDQPGLLADSPAAFANSQYVQPRTSRKGRSPYSLTNRGLSISLVATPFKVDTYVARLDCADGLLPAGDGHVDVNNARLGMLLRRMDEDDQYVRVKHQGKTFIQLEASFWDNQTPDRLRFARPVKLIDINVRQRLINSNTNDDKDRINGFRIATPELLERSRSGKDRGKDRFKVSTHSWDPETCIMSTVAGSYGTVGFLDIGDQDRKIKVIKLGFDFDFNPVCFIAASGGLSEKVHALDRNGKLNFNTDSQEAQWSKEELAQFPGIHQRNPFDTMAWSEMRNGTAFELRQHTGLWALKGDRIDGLQVRIASGDNFAIGILASLRIVRAELGDKLVWDVYLDNIKDTTMRKLFK